MRKLALFLIAALMLSVIPEIVSAQSNDPFEQQVIQTDKSSAKTKNKTRRRKAVTKEEAPASTPVPQPQPDKKVVETPANEMILSNPCSEWLDVEIVSIIGSRGDQTVQMTVKITNHDKNQRIYVGGDFIAYDCEGEEHRRGYATGSFDMITDVTIKTTIDIPGTINPNKTTVMPVISFSVGKCCIELRNAPIDWK